MWRCGTVSRGQALKRGRCGGESEVTLAGDRREGYDTVRGSGPEVGESVRGRRSEVGVRHR